MSRTSASKHGRTRSLADLPRLLRGERVLLRYPGKRDRAEFLALKRSNRSFLEPWEATPPDGADLFSEVAFDRLLKTRRSELNHRFVVCLRDDPERGAAGRIIGQISLGNIVRGAFQSCYVGYWIGQAYAGHGYMSESLALVLRFAFEDLGLHRAEANIIPRNKPSLGLVKKLGFRYEGTAKRYLRINGRWQDHAHWAITVEEWRRTSKAGTPGVTSRNLVRSRAST